MSQEEIENDIWTVKRALEWTCGYLERKGDENPRISAEWLIGEACGVSRIELYLHPERPLDREELDVLHDYVSRRGAGEPLQYITGEAPFRYLTLQVRPGVLIPRPETEVLVSEALACLPPAAKREARWNAEAFAQEAEAVAQWKERARAALAESGQGVSSHVEALGADDALAAGASDSASPAPATSMPDLPASDEDERDANEKGESAPYYLVADICTGSGCIACSIASERPDTRVIAVDLSDDAVSLARQNVEELGLSDRVKVLQGDLGTPIPKRYIGRFDAVVSNPPYVPTSVLDDIPQEVSAFEPALALDGGVDGLDVFRRLAPWARAALKEGGAFACELHETPLGEAARLALGCGFSSANIVNDLAGRPRVLVCRR